MAAEHLSNSESPGPLPEAVVVRLDNSHITVHTYPENRPDSGISTFRADHRCLDLRSNLTFGRR